MALRKKEGLYYDTSERAFLFKVSEWLYNQHAAQKVEILDAWMSDMNAELTKALVEAFALWSTVKDNWYSQEQHDEEQRLWEIDRALAEKYEEDFELPSFEERFKLFMEDCSQMTFIPPVNFKELCKKADDKRAAGITPLTYTKQKEYKKVMKNAIKNKQTLLN